MITYFRKFFRHITRPITPDWHDIFYYAFQRHLEHVGISLLLTLFFGLLLSFLPCCSFYFASLIVMLIFLYSKNKQGNIAIKDKDEVEIKDLVTDLNQYATSWVLTLSVYGHYKSAAVLMSVLALIYLLTYKWTKP